MRRQRRWRRMTALAFGFMPYRVPVDLVVGSPIEVVQCDNPSPEDVDKLHGKYIESLTRDVIMVY